MVAVARERLARPVLGVALEDQHRRRQAAGGQLAPQRDPVDERDRVAQLGLARAAQPPLDGPRAADGAAVLDVVGARDRLALVREGERAARRLARALRLLRELRGAGLRPLDGAARSAGAGGRGGAAGGRGATAGARPRSPTGPSGTNGAVDALGALAAADDEHVAGLCRGGRRQRQADGDARPGRAVRGGSSHHPTVGGGRSCVMQRIPR